MPSHQPADCAAALSALCTELRAQLDDGTPEPGRDYASDAAELGRIVTLATWARDAALVVARRADVQWSDLADAAGVSDSTLHGRYRRFLAREYS